MQIIHSARSLPSPFASSILTIGNFDGVHLGHQELLRRLTARARETARPAIVMTFEPHPVQVLYPDRKMHRIFDFEDQREQLEKLGVDFLVIEPFSREFSQLGPDRYLQDWIFKPFGPETLIVGYDFSFAANRAGSLEFLKERSLDMGFHCVIVPPVKVGGVLVSSSRIRQAIDAGDVKLARDLLGRSFYVKGLVEKGAGRGRTIGIPTANIRSTAETIPQRGVYCGWAVGKNGRHKAMINIGLNPTFTGDTVGHLSIEAHLLEFSGDLYGEEMKIEFVDRLRDEKKFSSVQELVAQIHRDILDGSRRLDEI